MSVSTWNWEEKLKQEKMVVAITTTIFSLDSAA
jgi:hypothetical protein